MPESANYPLLYSIDAPHQLRLLRLEQLHDLADELRRFLIEVTSQTGGHLAPGLGALELTLALHYVFNTPEDRLVWDIGHQAYPHKIITGRRDQFSTIRQFDGLSGFLKKSESEYDTFGAGHASTSISAALGMAVASSIQGEKREVVAVIGDGALTGGMAYEALNNAGAIDANLLVVLNDNEMSISPNVGAVSNYLARILSGRAYTTVRESKTVLGTLPPPLLRYARRCEEHIKGMVMPSTLFEELGFYYIGPVDGHDLKALISTLKNMRDLEGPRFLHVVTQKGKGFQPAEGDPCIYHGVTPFNPDTGKLEVKPKKARTFTHVFGDWLCDMATRDSRLIGITPAMREGSGLVRFSKEYSDRYFDVGIAEQHALTFAAGLACEGLKPVVAIYSTFLQRAYDQLIHDISLQDLDVLFAIDRAGFVGADGATHAGTYDFSYLRCIPNMLIMAPADEAECRNMLYTGFIHQGPATVRYPRGNGPGVTEIPDMEALPIGQGQYRKEGKDVAILSFGTMLATSLEVAEILGATVVNMRFVKPIDRELVLNLADSHSYLVTVEDNVVAGGAGSAVNELLLAERRTVDIINLGAPDRHIDQGSQQQQLTLCGLDTPGIVASIQGWLGSKTTLNDYDKNGPVNQ